MHFALKSACASVALVVLSVFQCGCQQQDGPSTTTSSTSEAASMNGAAGQMAGLYDGRQVTINVMQFSDTAASRIGNNKSHNTIYVYNDLDEPSQFLPVLDAIQGDGFNPLWEQVQIVFKPGVTPHQFCSDTDVLAATDITLVDTHELYRCSVVGPQKKAPTLPACM
jgi:hypothetical protein